MLDLKYRLVRSIVDLYARMFIEDIVVLGAENLFTGPKIIVGNHAYVTDSFVLPLILKERVHFAIMGDVFRLPLVGWLLRMSGQIPVYLGQGLQFLKQAQRTLAARHAVFIYPEGRLNLNQGLHPGQVGAAALALKTGLPVLPVGIYAPAEHIKILKSRLIWRRGTIGGWQFGGKIYLNFGPAFRAEMSGPLREQAAQFTSEMMGRIQALLAEARGYAEGERGLPAG